MRRIVPHPTVHPQAQQRPVEDMGRLRRAAVAATACTTTAFHVTTTPTRHSIKRHLYAPKGSGYVEKDEDSTLDRFRDWPDQYVPDETYEGTCVPGTARDNAPRGRV